VGAEKQADRQQLGGRTVVVNISNTVYMLLNDANAVEKHQNYNPLLTPSISSYIPAITLMLDYTELHGY